ncbi:DnaJ domain-containing protein [Altererythrobacter xixiisoli]|uniref:DnaJ domain-containing protein n=1 Tax=Croceibacterium xixiisoli TaxID=1476466 RepID=A0A6I4TXT0_9SPHN|nr:J domain-containing protein [Croceibacterium xixiisoli]MXO99448.1 DnaJ domain-containing protein [Croceibacterium xixiisoli]
MNHYEILGVDRAADADVIDAAYGVMIRRCHPDEFGGSNEDAEDYAARLEDAYAVLGDPDRRRAYDAALQPAAPASAPVSSPPVPVSAPSPSDENVRGLRRGGILALAGVTVLSLCGAAFYMKQQAVPVAAASIAPPIGDPAPVAPQPSPALAAETTTPAPCRGVDCRILTPSGWAGIEAGATVEAAMQASDLIIRDNGQYTDVDDGICLGFEVVGGPPSIVMLVEEGKISTVEAYSGNGAPVFTTDRGVSLGDPESAVHAAYTNLKEEPDIYSDAPDKKLIHYERGGQRGIKFSIQGGEVTGISVGTRSIEYTEGCL